MIKEFRIKNLELRINWWMMLSLALAGVLILALAGKPLLTRQAPKSVLGTTAVVAKDLYKEFVCSCCGQSIGECTCGEAAEKRARVDSFLTKGLDRKGVAKGMVKQYGTEVLFDQALAAEIKNQLTAEAPKDRPIIAISPALADLGDVPKKKVVSFDFQIKNSGTKDLVIDKLESSCECTTASVINQGVEGPVFGMEGHGDFKNPQGWSTTIAPDKEAILRVYYDPLTHKDLVGPVTRTVTVFSNDPLDPKVKVTIELNQL